MSLVRNDENQKGIVYYLKVKGPASRSRILFQRHEQCPGTCHLYVNGHLDKHHDLIHK